MCWLLDKSVISRKWHANKVKICWKLDFWFNMTTGTTRFPPIYLVTSISAWSWRLWSSIWRWTETSPSSITCFARLCSSSIAFLQVTKCLELDSWTIRSEVWNLNTVLQRIQKPCLICSASSLIRSSIFRFSASIWRLSSRDVTCVTFALVCRTRDSRPNCKQKQLLSQLNLNLFLPRYENKLIKQTWQQPASDFY